MSSQEMEDRQVRFEELNESQRYTLLYALIICSGAKIQLDYGQIEKFATSMKDKFSDSFKQEVADYQTKLRNSDGNEEDNKTLLDKLKATLNEIMRVNETTGSSSNTTNANEEPASIEALTGGGDVNNAPPATNNGNSMINYNVPDNVNNVDIVNSYGNLSQLDARKSRKNNTSEIVLQQQRHQQDIENNNVTWPNATATIDSRNATETRNDSTNAMNFNRPNTSTMTTNNLYTNSLPTNTSGRYANNMNTGSSNSSTMNNFNSRGYDTVDPNATASNPNLFMEDRDREKVKIIMKQASADQNKIQSCGSQPKTVMPYPQQPYYSMEPSSEMQSNYQVPPQIYQQQRMMQQGQRWY